MVFSVDHQKKDTILNTVIQQSRLLRILTKCSAFSIPVAMLISLLYMALHFFHPEFNAFLVNGVLQKDNLSAVGAVILCITFGVVAWYCFGLLVESLARKDLSERIDEWIGRDNDSLIYHFRFRYTAPSEEIYYAIPLTPADFEYDPALRKLTFPTAKLIGIDGGKSKAQKDSQDPQGEDAELIIYDYFTPSLHEYLTWEKEAQL